VREPLARHPRQPDVQRRTHASARARGHTPEKTLEVWELATGFAGYAFCKAHSTAYGVEAYQSAWLKHYFPAEFMAAVLTHGKGFYHPLVYVLECHRLGLTLLPPSVNEPGPEFKVQSEGQNTSTSSPQSIRVPLTRMKGLTTRTHDAILDSRGQDPFASMTDFFHRVAPSADELEAMIRVGAFDEFGGTRTRQFWQAQHLRRAEGKRQKEELDFGPAADPTASLFLLNSSLPEGPTRLERLQAETDLFGFAISGHPLELFPDIAWNTYCPVNRLADFTGQTVTTCGLVVEQRTHHQITGEPMKFLSIADWTGIVETELFARTYRSYGLATVRYPVLEIEARVEPFENNHGFSLRVLRAGKPRRAHPDTRTMMNGTFRENSLSTIRPPSGK
jgi:error-prone DNA polymerase